MSDRYLVLTGGVGGAKLCVGLAAVLPPEAVCFAVNVGDDFEHLGLQVSPDLDTLTYALAGLTNPDTGWGRTGESWNFLETVAALGGEAWFRLGDRDLALHVLRTARRRAGGSLTEVTAGICAALGVTHHPVPVSDDPVRTQIHTADGSLAFQHYFVRERCAPAVTGFAFAGADTARLNPRISEFLAAPDLAGIIIAPSNPYVSIDPILAIPALRECLQSIAAPVVGISPVVGGMALKGPTTKMMEEMGVPQTAVAVAAHYADILDGWLVDTADAASIPALAARGVAAIATSSVMLTWDDKVSLAHATLSFIRELRAA